MADLLECLAQIRALAETSPRLAALVGAADDERWHARPETAVWAPVEVLAHLADLELIYAARLRAMLTIDEPVLQTVDQEALAQLADYIHWPVADALARFVARRHDTLELLRSCSAAELERRGRHPRRGLDHGGRPGGDHAGARHQPRRSDPPTPRGIRRTS